MGKTTPSTWSTIVGDDLYQGLPLADASPGSMLASLQMMNRIWQRHCRVLCQLTDSASNVGRALTASYQTIGRGVCRLIDVSVQRQVKIHVYGANVSVRVTLGGVTLAVVSVGGPSPTWASSSAQLITGATLSSGLADVQIEAKYDVASPRALQTVLVEEVAQTSTLNLPDENDATDFFSLDDDAIQANGPYDAWLVQRLHANLIALRNERSRGWSEILPLLDPEFTDSRHYLGHTRWRGDGPYLINAEPWTDRARVSIVVRSQSTGDVELFAMSSAEDFDALLDDGGRVETHADGAGQTTYTWTVAVRPGRINAIWIMSKGELADSGGTIGVGEVKGGHVFFTANSDVWSQATEASGGNYPLTWARAIFDGWRSFGSIGNDAGTAADTLTSENGTVRDVCSVEGRQDSTSSGGNVKDRFFASPSLVFEGGPGPQIAIPPEQSIGPDATLYTVGIAQLYCVCIESRSSRAAQQIQLAENTPSAGAFKSQISDLVNQMQSVGTPQFQGRCEDMQEFYPVQINTVPSIDVHTAHYGDWIRIADTDDEKNFLIPLGVDPNSGAGSGLLSSTLLVSFWVGASRLWRSRSDAVFARVRIRSYDLATGAIVEQTQSLNIPCWDYSLGPPGQRRTATELAVYGAAHNVQAGTTATNVHRTVEGAYTGTKIWPQDVGREGLVWSQTDPIEIDISGASYPALAKVGVTNLGFFDAAEGYPGVSDADELGIVHVAAVVAWAGPRS